jgi:general secretion pathway protein E
MNAPLETPLHAHVLSDEVLRAAAANAAARGQPLLAVLADELGLDPASVLPLLAAALSLPLASVSDILAWRAAFEVLPFADCLRHKIVPMRDGDGALRMLTGDPLYLDLRTVIEERLGDPAQWMLTPPDEIEALLARHEETVHALDSSGSDAGVPAGSDEKVEDLSLQAIAGDASNVVRLVRSTLHDALKAGASDIHLETGNGGITVKYRIDGVLVPVGNIPGSDVADQVISRIKVLSELDISERRVPQDGRFKVLSRGRHIDLRVSIMPSIHGEDAVLRVLDKQALSDQVRGLCLDVLGFDAESLRQIRRLCNEPYGMFLVTGPTGSGKTTSLYGAINEINHGRDKIITIEDPVEYQLPGVLQIPVNEKKGLTFARGLRSILRHDPDKIMVGEIRDGETAQIAVQAALTGHLVLTTIHANNVFDVIGRFMHMQVDPHNLVAALNGILAQRLLRVNCPHCAADDPPDAELLADSRLTDADLSGYAFRSGRGCGQCRGSGYKGRRAIAELLVLNDELREMITSREPIRAIKEAARRNGTRSLRDVALDLVRSGETNLQEINRVTFVE